VAQIRLDRSALHHNFRLIHQRSQGRFAAVLKDNAYGHGLTLIAQELARLGVERAVVRNRHEALQIASLFPWILVLADHPRADGFHYAINELATLRHAPRRSRVQLKIDTGMHRNGLIPEELEQAFKLVKERGLLLTGVFTHFRSADELGSDLFWQRERWRQVKERLFKLIARYHLPPPTFHSANSAALFRAGIDPGELARVGIALYGYIEYPPSLPAPALKPVLSLWARRIATRHLDPGSRIGYGGVFEAQEAMVVSTYDVGYADGLFRSMRQCAAGAILGRMSMDSLVLAGRALEVPIITDAKRIAHDLGTISYEVLVKLAPTLPRSFSQTPSI